jgi:adenosylmethionine-8-amino-7-oxononanoate aminotransferase
MWHPFADMATVPGREIVLTRGEGVHVFDERGRRYLDATASLWYSNVGFGRVELAEVAARQLRTLHAYSTFDVYANRPALDLAERLSDICPIDDSVVFLTSGGSDSIDTAGKLVGRYWQLRGQPQRTAIVARSESYHGMHVLGTSLAGIELNATGWGPLVPDVLHVPHGDSAALAELLEREGERIAAFIGEPIIGAGGVIPPPGGYWAEVQRLCRAHDVLLIADEVVTGFGRTGPWFACERYGIEPDLVTGAKGITSGYLPLGVVLCGPRVRDVLWAPGAGPLRHGYTYSGHAAACAVALANLEIVEREGLRERVRTLEPVLAATVGALTDEPLVSAVRSAGLLAAVELDAAARATFPGLAERAVARLRERGILSRALVGHSLQLSPPFTIAEDELALVGAAIRDVLRELQAELEHEHALARR